VFPGRDGPSGDIALDVRGVRNVSLTVRRGEIVGLAGLVGSVRTRFAKTLFGLTPADAGEVFINGTKASIRSPADAVALGLAYVPEDRRNHGVILGMALSANTTMASLQSISSGGFLRFAEERRVAQDYISKLSVKAPSTDTLAGELS